MPNSPELIRYIRKKYPVHSMVQIGSLMAMYNAKVLQHLDDGSIKLEVTTPTGIQQKVVTFQDSESNERFEERFYSI